MSRPASSLPLPATRLLNRATISAATLAGIIFAIDLAAPRAAGVGMLYVLPLLVGTLEGPPRFQFVAASVVSVLAVLGGWIASANGGDSFVVSARVIALLVIWTTAVVLERFRRTGSTCRRGQRPSPTSTRRSISPRSWPSPTPRAELPTSTRSSATSRSTSREELLGQDHRIINSDYHPEEFIRSLWVTIANGRIWRGEIRNRAKDGTIYWVDTTIVPFLDERGKPYQYMAIRYEITERKRSEERLQEQEALARLGQMAAVVAHEVKNPIAGIRGALQVIGTRMAADARDKPIIAEIIARLDALNGIVQDLLVFARPRALRAEPTDLKALVLATVGHLKRDPSLHAVAIEVDGNGAVVDVDAEQLQLAVQNVLMNAAQAMNGEGSIHVDIVRHGGEWQIAVADNGPGMPPEVKAKVFDPFFTTRSRGTGLGLPIARRVVEAHGGRIGIETPAGGGTVVSMSLPAVRSTMDDAQTKRSR